MVLALCLSLLPASALAATAANGSSLTELAVTLKNDCDAAVKYSIVLGDSAAQEVTLAANESLPLKGDKGTAYSITWVEGSDPNYIYEAPDQKTLTGTIGSVATTRYYYKNSENGGECTNEVAKTISYGGYTMDTEGSVYYDVTSLVTFRRTSSVGYTYTNVNNEDETYKSGWDLKDSSAYTKVYEAYPSYDHTRAVDGALVPNESYMFMYKTVEPRTDTVEVENIDVTFTATAIASGTTGTFKVAALNVDGMPQSVKIASIYDLKLNEDGPGAEGSVSIGQYIEKSGIDLLALSEDFNFFQEMGSNAPSYATMTQRERIPTEVGVGDLKDSLFPFDTDGLNLMYKNNLTVSSESMTAWNEHYSPFTFYGIGSIGVNVPDQNGADGMIDKGFRFYQVQMAPGVVVDVYILHMDAETSDGDNAARASQIDQLMEAVNANDNGNPIIIMGDTNCRYTRDPLQSTIIAAGFSDPWIDLKWDGIYPQMGDDALMVTDPELGYQKGEVVDKVFYKDGTNVKLKATNYFVDAEGYTDEDGLLGDHPPVIVTFEYSFTSSTVEHEHEWSSDWSKDAGYHWHECTVEGCDISLNSQKDGYEAHDFDVTNTTPATCTEAGSQTLTCSVCGYEKTEIIPATGHIWDEGKITTEPTATEDGEMTYTCTVCHNTRTEIIPATGAHASYTFEVRLDKESYNVGDTVTAGIYVSSENEGANFGTVGFKLNVPTGLTFQKMTSDLTGGQISVEGSNYAFNVDSNTPVYVTSEGVKLATVTFTANGNFEGESASVDVSLAEAEITEIKQHLPADSTTAPDSATLYRTYTVTFTAGEHVTMEETSATVRTGTTFGSVEKPHYTVDANYTFDGWYNGETLMADDTAITGNITVTAKASAKQFTFSQSADNALIQNLTGVSDSKATYGTDITFTVAPDSGYVVSEVSYTVGNSAATPLTADNGTYTIPGSAITGDIAVEVTATKYHTVTFAAGTGVNMTSATAYVKDGQAALYTGTDFKTPFTIPTPSAQKGYRLAADTVAEPMWSDGNNKYQTSALGSSVIFADDATLTAQAVKQWTVTFAAGEHGTLSGTTSFVVDNNAAVPSDKIPTVTANTGYTFTGWDNDITAPITADTTFTARYKNATYTLTLPTVDGVSFEVDGAVEEDGVYTVTYGTNVIITMTVDETEVDVESLSYTIGNGDPVTVNDFTKPFTIAGDSITGNIIVNLTSDAIYQITVTVEGGNGTVNGSDSATLSLKEGTTAEELAAQFTFAAAPGYQVVAPKFDTVTADKTYTATFTHATYPVTWPEGVEGVESATHGTDLTFTAKLEDELLLGVQYQVGNGSYVTLIANDEGKYIIPGDAIIGNITVIYTTVTGSWDYITAEFYAAAPAGEKVALLNAFKLGEGTYALDGYGDMFWSSKYSAYVCFVADSETNDTLTKKLAVSQNTVTEISYSGDINGTVTPADSAAINAVLHSIQVEYKISDLMRFQFDVLGDKQITAQDIMWILTQYTGVSQN